MSKPRDLGQWQYKPPSGWDHFERMSRDLWSRIWNNPNTQRHGRSGQAQQGVDVYGKIENKGWGGVQCKKRDAYSDDSLTEDELRSIVEEAKKFQPPLSEFTVAYTGKSNQKLQELARIISDEHEKLGLFRVFVYSWDDMVEQFGSHGDLILRT